jgi:hypothetical protein
LKIKRLLTIFFKKYFPNEYFGFNGSGVQILDFTELHIWDKTGIIPKKYVN